MAQDTKEREQLVRKLNQKFGDYSVFKMDSREDIMRVKALPTGSLSLDMAIGVGGFPRGRITEIYGPEAAGKSLLLLSTIAQTQANGGYCAFIDVEHALSPDFARLLGVDTQQLYYSQPDDGEQALEIMEELIQSGLFDIVGLDSVAALVTKKELEIGYGEHKIADTAIMMAKALKRMTHEISKTQTVAVFINQLRERPMVMFGNPEYTPGGRSLKFYASLRIHVKKVKVELDVNKRQIAHQVECSIQKNKVAPPFATCTIRLDYKQGIDQVADILAVAVDAGVIVRESSWYTYKEHKWNGLHTARVVLTENKSLREQIYQEMRQQYEQRTACKKEDTAK